MINANIQKSIDKWIKIYRKESDADLIQLYREDFQGKSTPRRDEDKAREKALIALIGDKLNQQVRYRFHTNTCAHCGASDGLHRYDTQQCPKNGMEEFREGRKQEWEETTFEDSGIQALRNASEDMYYALKACLPYLKAEGTNGNHWVPQIEKALAKAEGK